MKRRRDPLLFIGLLFLGGLLLLAIVSPWVGQDPLKTGTIFLPPSSEHWFGTDELGRDIFARIAYGARVSLLIGFVVQTVALVTGIFMGTLGVFAPKWIRTIVNRFTDGMFAFPDILLAMLIIGLWSAKKSTGSGFFAEFMNLLPVMVALSITAWPGLARLVAAQLASLKDREYVVAARAAGASTFYIVTRHVLPQLWGILIAVSMVELAGTILAESTLSFLGIGVQAPIPSWGSMINNARTDMNSHPILLLWPCAVLSLTIFALNFVGDGLRARFDPKSH